jgi:phage gp16-like protein
MANNVAAIHVLKNQLQLADDDYRALLRQLTAQAGGAGKDSCSAMTDRERAGVRAHMEALAERMGVGRKRRPMTRVQFEQARRKATPKERKVWALWHQLARDGRVQDVSARALNAWVTRQVSVSALEFCTDAQLDALIEALKHWELRR